MSYWCSIKHHYIIKYSITYDAKDNRIASILLDQKNEYLGCLVIGILFYETFDSCLALQK